MIVSVLVGARFGPRQHVFDAVIDKVEVKTIGELSPNEIEHDNPEIRHTDELCRFLGQLYNREITVDEHRDGDPLLGGQAELRLLAAVRELINLVKSEPGWVLACACAVNALLFEAMDVADFFSKTRWHNRAPSTALAGSVFPSPRRTSSKSGGGRSG